MKARSLPRGYEVHLHMDDVARWRPWHYELTSYCLLVATGRRRTALLARRAAIRAAQRDHKKGLVSP